MEKDIRDFIINELMVPGFIENKTQEMILEESEETGRSELKVYLKSSDNLCIANVDKKKTDIQFFKTGKTQSMYKRVDHIIFEHLPDDKWKLYLIEMKGSVGEEKWKEIKGKFRASYLIARAIAGMLELQITETAMYTTFENVRFTPPDTMPSARRIGTGRTMIRMKDEWEGTRFGLNFGKRISFRHHPIKMERNKEKILVGDFIEKQAIYSKNPVNTGF